MSSPLVLAAVTHEAVPAQLHTFEKIISSFVPPAATLNSVKRQLVPPMSPASTTLCGQQHSIGS